MEEQEEVAERGRRSGGAGRLTVIVTELGTLERVENLCDLESAR